MLNLPKSTEYRRRIPKQMFYENLKVQPDIKRLFVEQLRVITWANKLSPQTMNIDAGKNVQEIEVFHLKLSGTSLDDRLPELMDRQIPYHILYLLESPEGQFCLQIAYKEQSSGANTFQIKKHFATSWQPLEQFSLPLSALDMDGLYEAIVRYIAGEKLTGHTEDVGLKETVELTEEQERLKKRIATLKSKMRKERQLSRQMELRREIVKLERSLLDG